MISLQIIGFRFTFTIDTDEYYTVCYKVNDAKTFKNLVYYFMLAKYHVCYRLARLTGIFKIIAIDFQCCILWGIIRRISNYMLHPFHLQSVNKFYRNYKPVRITQQKEHPLIRNSETTQNLNIYLHNQQTETAIFLAKKHEKTTIACSYLNFSIQKIHQNSKKQWLL